MELPEDVKEQLAGFEAAVASVEEGLEPLLGADRRELEAQLNPVERAKVHVTLANAVSTLFCSAFPSPFPLVYLLLAPPSHISLFLSFFHVRNILVIFSHQRIIIYIIITRELIHYLMARCSAGFSSHHITLKMNRRRRLRRLQL